jgi:hypothetical protein
MNLDNLSCKFNFIKIGILKRTKRSRQHTIKSKLLLKLISAHITKQCTNFPTSLLLLI